MSQTRSPFFGIRLGSGGSRGDIPPCVPVGPALLGCPCLLSLLVWWVEQPGLCHCICSIAPVPPQSRRVHGRSLRRPHKEPSSKLLPASVVPDKLTQDWEFSLRISICAYAPTNKRKSRRHPSPPGTRSLRHTSIHTIQ